MGSWLLPWRSRSVPGPAAAFCVIVEPPTPLPTQVNGTQVEIQLTEGFARVVIIKEFYNPSDEPKQGQIAFPLEKGHDLITDLRMKIGNVTYGSSRRGPDSEPPRSPCDPGWVAFRRRVHQRDPTRCHRRPPHPVPRRGDFLESVCGPEWGSIHPLLPGRRRPDVRIFSSADPAGPRHPGRRVREHGVPRPMVARERRGSTDRQ